MGLLSCLGEEISAQRNCNAPSGHVTRFLMGLLSCLGEEISALIQTSSTGLKSIEETLGRLWMRISNLGA